MTDIATGDNGDRLHVALGTHATEVVKVMAATQGVDVPELVRRTISLYRMVMALSPDEQLMIRRANGDLERVRIDRWVLTDDES